MKKLLSTICAVALLVACATTAKNPVPETTQTFQQPFDRVWSAVVSELSGDWPLQVIEKGSGVLESQMVGVSRIEEYGIKPSLFLPIWSQGRGRISVFVKQSESTTTVRIKGHFEGFESNVTQAWYVWPSTGVLEKELLDKIAAKLE